MTEYDWAPTLRRLREGPSPLDGIAEALILNTAKEAPVSAYPDKITPVTEDVYDKMLSAVRYPADGLEVPYLYAVAAVDRVLLLAGRISPVPEVKEGACPWRLAMDHGWASCTLEWDHEGHIHDGIDWTWTEDDLNAHQGERS